MECVGAYETKEQKLYEMLVARMRGFGIAWGLYHDRRAYGKWDGDNIRWKGLMIHES